MADSDPYADPVKLLCDWLPLQEPIFGVRTATHVPADLAPILADGPLIHVTRPPGGGDDVPGIDVALIDLDVYLAGDGTNQDLAGAQRLAATVRGLMRFALPGHTTSDGHRVSRVSTDMVPVELPYDPDTDITRYGATYRVTVHSRTTT
ncbi:MAG: hypothetical protein EPO06_12050 [Burkholderiaceae bacterium]|nr:MAG: hypothetical protein EPO06_12050 [Burkholderiaceae bacterium]